MEEQPNLNSEQVVADDGEARVPFTQFLRPHGMQQTVYASVTHEYGRMAYQVLEAEDGRYKFECEVLATGEVSLTCADKREEEDIAIELATNGLEVKEATRKLIESAHLYVCGGNDEDET